MYANAVYREGIARTTDGAVYVQGLPSTTSVSTVANAGGADVSPAGLKVNSDGAIYVRYV